MSVRDSINNRLPDGVRLGWGTTYIFTEETPAFMTRIANWDRIDAWHDIGIISFIASMVISILILGFVAWSTIQSPPEPTAAQDPVNLLAIPGLNEFLPLNAAAYIVVALLIAAAVHELAHGVAMYAEDISVDEVGIGCLVIFPIAAYVMPDEDEFENASPRARARILSAGVFANLWVFVITSLLFLLPMTGSPITGFFAYFGAALGGTVPDSATVESLSPVTNFLFWTWFLNINLAFVNVLPVAFLDGGRISGIAGGLSSKSRINGVFASIGLGAIQFPESVSVSSDTRSKAVVAVTSVGTVGVFLIAVFGPVFLQ